jgi:hypothetical protein
MYYSYIEIEYVATSFSPARMDLALKLLIAVETSIFCPKSRDVPVQRMAGTGYVERGLQFFFLPLIIFKVARVQYEAIYVKVKAHYPLRPVLSKSFGE